MRALLCDLGFLDLLKQGTDEISFSPKFSETNQVLCFSQFWLKRTAVLKKSITYQLPLCNFIIGFWFISHSMAESRAFS